MPRALPILCLVVAVGGAACSGALMPFSQDHIEMRDYKPLSVPSNTPVRQRWDRLQRLAASESWRLETFDETRGLMIAARPSADSSEVREHLRVLLRNDRTEVAVQTEVLVDGEWDMRDLTCGKYEYARETAIAVELDATDPRR